MVQAVWQGVELARSQATKIVEGNHYFPPEDVDQRLLEPSDTTTTCPWKGQASYYHVVVDGSINRDAAWYYPDPEPEADKLGIKDHVAFWRGVQVS